MKKRIRELIDLANNGEHMAKVRKEQSAKKAYVRRKQWFRANGRKPLQKVSGRFKIRGQWFDVSKMEPLSILQLIDDLKYLEGYEKVIASIRRFCRVHRGNCLVKPK